MSFWGILSLDNNDLFSRNKIGLFHNVNPKVPFVWGLQLFLRASDWPDTLVTVWPHQLVELVESCQVYVRQQRRAAHALLQVLPHSVVAESVQDELQLQDRLQPPLLRLLPLQLLPPSRLLHHLLDLMTATVQGHCQPARMRQHTNTLGGSGRPYVLSQYDKGLLQFPCKFQVIHDLLVFGQGLLKRWEGVKSCARLGYNIFVCVSGCQEYLYPPADHDWDSPRCSFWLDNHRACSVMQQCRVMKQEVGDGLQWDTEAVDCRSTAVAPAGCYLLKLADGTHLLLLHVSGLLFNDTHHLFQDFGLPTQWPWNGSHIRTDRLHCPICVHHWGHLEEVGGKQS